MGVRGTEKPAGNPDRYRRQSMILVPLPHRAVVVQRMLPAFGYDEAPHGHAEVVFDNVRVPAASILLGGAVVSGPARAGSGRAASAIACG